MLKEDMPEIKKTNPMAARFGAALLICALLIAGSLGVGYELGKRQNPNASDKADLSNFWDAWGIIDKKFYGDINDEDRVDGAIGGMVSGLGDPYTTYLDPKQNKLFQQDLQGEFGGIGAELTIKGGQLVIQSVLDDTPAFRAALLTNDVILKIDETEVSELSFVEAIDKIRGTVGTNVVLSIAREGKEKPFDVTITRAVIVVKSVVTDTIGANKDVGYIKVNQFGEDTTQAFANALLAAKQAGNTSVVVDLRNNPGGYLQAALDMIGLVLPDTSSETQEPLKNRIGVIEKGKKGDKELKAGATQVLTDLPMVVLVNEGSASASEIFAGAMKDYKRAQVIGAKTFGKGSVQELQDLDNGGSIKVTVAKWFTPLGTGIDKMGIEPDITVELPEDTTASKDDLQVQKALEILSE